MSRQIIDVGAALNDGTGESLRDAFIKVNNNFLELFTGGIAGTNLVILNNTISSIQGNIELAPVGSNPVVVANNNPVIISNSTVSINSTSGALTVAGGVGIGGNLNVLGDINTTANASVNAVTATGFYGSYYYANGQSVVSTFYTDSNVGAYLPTHTGNVAANFVFASNYRYANGAIVGNYSNSNVQSYLPTYSNLLGGTLTTALQPNITSVGTLTSLTVSGTVTANTLNASQIGNSGSVLTGTLTTAAQNNITSVGTLTGLTVSGTANITNARGNFGGPFNGTIGATTPNTAAFTNIGLNNATANTIEASILGNVGTSLVGTLATASQTNVTSLGNLTGLSSAGVVAVYNTNNATGDTTGAFRVYGGASISKDLWVIGNIYTSNIVSVGTSSLSVNVPLLYLNSSNTYPYNYDIGFFSNAVTGVANLETYTGFARNHLDNVWYLFSNADTPSTLVDFANSSILLDTIKVGGAIVDGTLDVSGAASLNTIDADTILAVNIGNASTELTGTVLTNSQPYIETLGTLTSLEVTGATTVNYIDADSIYAANIGNVGTELVGTLLTNSQPYIETVGTLNALSVAGNIASGNVDANNLTASQGVYAAQYYYANGLAINFGTTYSNSNVDAYLVTYTGNTAAVITEANQPYITSLGNLTALNVDGSIWALNIDAGTINGTHYGDHNGQVGASTPNSGAFTTLTASGNANINTLSAATLAAGTIGNAGTIVYGTISTATQGSITSLGTLTGLTVSGTANITNARGNLGGPFNGTVGATTPNTGAFTTLTTSGNVSVGSDLTVSGNLTVSGTQTVINSTAISVNDLNIVLANNAASAAAADGAGITVNGANASITYVNATDSWTFNKGVVLSGGLQNTIIGNGTAAAGTFTTLTATSGYQGSTNGEHNGTVGATTANTGAFTSITATSTITGSTTIRANGNIVAASTTDSTSTSTGAVVISGGLGVAKNMTIAGNITPSANVTYNLGTTTASWANVYAVTFVGTSTTAIYADLAECYVADSPYTSGTVLDFGGSHEVTLSNQDASSRVAGVVSTNPAHLMNSAAEGDFVVALALVGRVPCKVVGPVNKGDTMVSAGNGRARSEKNPQISTVIGKALEDFAGDIGTIEIVVGRL